MLIYNYIMLISTYHRHAFRAQNWVATIRKGRREHFVHLAIMKLRRCRMVMMLMRWRMMTSRRKIRLTLFIVLKQDKRVKWLMIMR